MLNQKQEAVTAPPPLSPEQMQALRAFVRSALGDGRVTAWEENFLNGIKHRLNCQSMWLTDRQQAIVQEIKDKLHYDRPDVPLPPIDPDGIEENEDVPGQPVARRPDDQFEDNDDLFDWLQAAA
jgi:hypothetical protein